MGLSDTAGGFIDGMKNQPVAFGLVAVIFALLALLYYQSALFSQQRSDNVKLFVAVQQEAQKILAQCVVPPRP